MSRRTIATIQRPEPHDFEADDIDPSSCKVCRLIEANGVHSVKEIARHRAEQDAEAARIHEAQEGHRKRTGER